MTRFKLHPEHEPVTLPERFAAPAPLPEVEDEEAALVAQEQADRDHALDELCERFAHWSITRRFYGGPKPPTSLLGQLARRTRPMRLPPDADCSPLLAAMHLALAGHPADAIGRRVFELHYLHRVPNVKAASAALGISRAHWYRVLGAFRREVYASAIRIDQASQRERSLLSQQSNQACHGADDTDDHRHPGDPN